MKKLTPITHEKYNNLESDVYYNLGGMNYFTGNGEARGYYGSVTPMTVSENFKTYTGFTGIKVLLIECKRKNNKSYTQAIELFKTKEIELTDLVYKKLAINNQGKINSQLLGINLPPKYHNLSLEELKSMPVEIHSDTGSKYYNSITEVDLDSLKSLCGCFAGKVDGINSLRFESQKIYNMLSQ